MSEKREKSDLAFKGLLCPSGRRGVEVVFKQLHVQAAHIERADGYFNVAMAWIRAVRQPMAYASAKNHRATLRRNEGLQPLLLLPQLPSLNLSQQGPAITGRTQLGSPS